MILVNEEDYYIPITLNRLVEIISGYLKDPGVELTGEELIVGCKYVDEEEYDIPPKSIIFTLQRSSDDTNDPDYGILCIGPDQPRMVM